MKNIKVSDDDFLDIADSFQKTSEELDVLIQAIASEIKTAGTKGFSEGNISINLQKLSGYILELKDELKDIGTDVQTYMQNYLRDLDEADEYIY